MSRWLLIPTLLWAVHPTLAAPLQPSPSPEPAQQAEEVTTAPSEAQSLWEDGESALAAGRYSEAIAYFNRLVRSHPADAQALPAHRELGIAYLKAGKPARAIAPLKYFVADQGRTPAADSARVILGRAYLGAHKKDEALLIAGEILSHHPSPSLHLDALVLKAQALLALSHDTRASQSVRSASEILGKLPQASPEQKSLVPALDLTLKLRRCSRYPSRRTLTEAQTLSQLDRRGDCLQSALLAYREILQSGDSKQASDSTDQLMDAFIAYRAACAHPPRPPGKLSSRELDEYRRELSAQLKDRCDQKVSDSKNLTKGWKVGLPSEMVPLLEKAIP